MPQSLRVYLVLLFSIFVLAAPFASAEEASPPSPPPSPAPKAVIAAPEAPPSPPPAAVPPLAPPPLPVQTQIETVPKFRDWGLDLSANVPHPIFLELEHRFNSKWSMGLGGGGIGVHFNLGTIPAQLAIGGVDARLRWHPWGGSFFLGAALGAQKFSGEATDAIPVTVNGTAYKIDTTVNAQIASAYLTPHLGWLWIWNSGFMLGFDLGLQLPIKPQTTFDITTDNSKVNVAIDIIQSTKEYQNLDAKLRDAGDKIGKIPLPYVTLLRLGWMF